MEPDPTQDPNASGANSGAPSRKWSSMKIFLRLLIYIPLLGYFGWQSGRRILDQRQIGDDNFRAELQQWLAHPPRTIVMPNGETMPVFELTEDEAVEMGLMAGPGEGEAAAKPSEDEQP